MSWTVILEEDPETGDLILPLPQELLDLQGWKEDDTLDWIDNGNGTWSLQKAVEMKCDTCNHAIHEDCNYKQGRCPHRKPMIDIQPKDTSKGHFYASLTKSGFRILAGANLMVGNFFVCGLLIVVAEILGIVEELV